MIVCDVKLENGSSWQLSIRLWFWVELAEKSQSVGRNLTRLKVAQQALVQRLHASGLSCLKG